MTRDEAVLQCQRILGYISDKSAEIAQVMGFQQSELEKGLVLPWFLKTEILNMMATPLQERLAYPTGFLRVWQEDGISIMRPGTETDTVPQWDELKKDSPDILRKYFQDTGNLLGVTKAFADDDASFILFPTPDAAYTYRLTYFKADRNISVLTGGETNLWLTELPYLLIGMTVAQIAAGSRDQGALQVATGLVTAGMNKMNTITTIRNRSGRKDVIGDPDN